MNHIKSIIKSMVWLLPCLFAAPFTSCSFEDDNDSCGSGTASLQITVTARDEGDLNSRAAGDTETGITGEFMNDNLVVLLVDASNKVALKLTPDLSSNTAAQQGNLKTWVSDQLTIETGTYTAYAFANIDETYYEGWSDVIDGITEGGTLDASTFTDIILDDPAGKIDFANGHYIPLSASPLTITISSSTSGISIGLDRLVGKVRPTIQANTGITVSYLTFGGYADKVSLMADATLPDDTSYDLEKTITINQTITSSSEEDTTGTLTIDDFYVNETRSGHAFTVDVATTENNGVIYTATTTTNELPRNYIFPLTLKLNEYELEITVKCSLWPIGNWELPVTPITTSTYEVTIPVGCTFEFEVNSINDNITPTSCSWELADSAYVNYIYFDGQKTSVTGTTATGACSADETYGTYTIYITVAWTDSGKSFTRTYSLIVKTDDMNNFSVASSTSAATRGFVGYTTPEVLTLSPKTE